MADYFVIDGTSITKYSKKDLEKALLEGDVVGDFVDEIPDGLGETWGMNSLIIRGSIVLPKAKETWEV